MHADSNGQIILVANFDIPMTVKRNIPKGVSVGKLHYPACPSATKFDDDIIHGLVKTPHSIILQPFHMVESLISCKTL